MRKYRLVAKKGEGTFSEVYGAGLLLRFFFADTARRAATNCFLAQNCLTTGTATEQVLKAQNVKDGKYHAIKCMKNHFDSIDQVRRQSGLACFAGCLSFSSKCTCNSSLGREPANS